MKTFGIIHILLFLILMLAYQCVSAQDYVITTKGDSITGTVKQLVFGPDKKVQVTKADKKKEIIPIFQVKRFSLKGEKYQPVKGPNGYSFMKLLKEGYVSLFAFQQENQTSYDGRFLLKRDGEGTEVPNLSFKKMMTRFFDDCASVSTRIDEGTYGKKELLQIIDEYNACIVGRTAEHTQAATTRVEQVKKINSWDALEEKVKGMADFDGKTNALEMISEIKSKISRSEKVPNFLVTGLKGTLPQPELQTELEAALKELN
ncbi:MAG TPA: hypothetical protein VIN08_06170 [Ohtaekwangia sp.]|uniref:hypothetical protein n=1 Tax=Ohtaekwangia sp. TaxID=2066019 RepID=UPI002F920723